jgi:deoxyribonuclease-1-like protein
MSRFTKTILLALVIAGGVWALSNQDKNRQPSDVVSLMRQKLAGIQTGIQTSQSTGRQAILPSSIAQNPSIRIASFKLTGYETTLHDLDRLPLLVEICRRYDAIALQGIDGRDEAWLRLLTDTLNASSQYADYDFISDRDGLNRPTPSKTQSAILFNRKTLELDHLNWYTVNDPDDLLQREPLVGWFRTRVPNSDAAFTFTLVNVELTPVRTERELSYVGELFRAIRNDGRGEDDVIIAGDFHAGDRGLESIQQRDGLTWVLSNTPTDILNTTQYDNLVFSEIASTEFTGRGGVFDFMRKFNLRLHDAAAVSERLPVWAEFSVFEGQAARFADGFQNQPTSGVAWPRHTGRPTR